jgi:ubiquinol-cytochrome c reductase iron-sulfur subunit
MSNDGVNVSRRRFLTAATSVVGAAGVVGAAVPFVGSWNPSAKAKAAGAPVKFDASKLEPGEMKTVEWRGQPVYVVRRSEAQVAELAKLDDKLKDPQSTAVEQQPGYVDLKTRSIKPELLVLVGLCTHLGCAPQFRPALGEASGLGAEWVGGFFCACHGSKFDLAGRVFEGVPASLNLKVPPYSYESDSVIVVGVDQENA